MERPILMTTENVKAILEGRKTQTRRTKGMDKINDKPDLWKVTPTLNHSVWAFFQGTPAEPQDLIRIRCPYGQVGDRLWVSETFCQACYKADKYEDVCYKEDLIREGQLCHITRCKWQPSIHMPRWASRITLEITEIRVEMVQEITEEDAIAEGIDYLTGIADKKMFTHINSFKNLWDSINGKKYPWKSNPFCWVITFKHLV